MEGSKTIGSFVRITFMEMIPKKDMEEGQYYSGRCRNSLVALWDHKRGLFVHIRYKFGFMLDTIEHFEDVKDKGLDGFIPVQKIEPPNFYEMKDLKRKIGY